jgi:hypothetical protein
MADVPVTITDSYGDGEEDVTAERETISMGKTAHRLRRGSTRLLL